MDKELLLQRAKLQTLILCEVRYNHNHGKNGRFTFSDGTSGGRVTFKKRIAKEAEKVQSRLSNEAKPFQKEAVSMEDVKDRGKLSDKEAEECVRLAEGVFDEAASKEPTITRDVIASAEEAGGQMYGLDYRMKQPTSMAGKIGADARDEGKSFEETAENIKDAVRYTVVLPENGFTSGYETIRRSMESRGYTEVRCKNFFQRFKEGKSDQKAVQCVYADSSGFTFEFQFHTAASQGAKEINHPLYEKQRKATTKAKTKATLSKIMNKNGTYVPNPVGVMNIKDHSKP